MTSDERVLWVRIQLEELVTEREAMLTENALREQRGEAQAYSADSLPSLVGRMQALREQLR